MRRLKNVIIIIILLLLILPPFNIAKGEDYIKWLDFNASYDILSKCYEYDVNSFNSTVHYNFIELLSYITLKNGNKFNNRTDFANLKKIIELLNLGKTMDEIVGKDKYYRYYYEAYSAIFSRYLGEFIDPVTKEIKYGLIAYHPFARGYWMSGSDDFGNARNYGFKRKHLGHDMYGSIGTPIISVEGGTVMELGWNRYGGWRIGILSHDTKRYYYYAHLRKNKPFIKDLKRGDKVEAGQVIGYLGVTGYSYKENTNMGTRPHLHFGLQLIFHPSQIDGNGEIWIDVYNICRFLNRNRAQVVKTENDDFMSVNLRRHIE
ncbi:MAG: M23 family metallopeptidase [Christensenellales bacterium]|jgi:murein DD-endopeptidase MepM/ murein hydrolase activator NlpD